ncbi:MAG: LysR family transcriptional regulator [Rhizobiales bacterium]|nr:LysR family transcriptional regulator [Hyphomicrobiales bacterium]MBI3673580.1 LysR family transcriptional regulator [Hyphomicrobiales bacterium]
MNWDDLRFVLAVSRGRSLAAAGREIRVDPTTVGRRIVAIETELGARLFDRTAEGFFATRAGEIAIAQAQAIELRTLALEQEVAGSDERVEGPVRVTALDATIDGLIIKHLPKLLSRHPGLELTFASDFKLLDLSRREADVAVRASMPTHPDAVGRLLGRQATGAYCRSDFEVGEAPPLVGFPRSLDGTGIATALASLFPKGRIVARVNSEGHLLSLVRAGVGVGLIDCFVGDADPHLRRAVAEPVAVYDMWAVAHVDMRQAPRVRAVIDFLSEIYAEEAELIRGNRPR